MVNATYTVNKTSEAGQAFLSTILVIVFLLVLAAVALFFILRHTWCTVEPTNQKEPLIETEKNGKDFAADNG